MAASSISAIDEQPIHLALPKGHMQENVFKLFEDAGIKVRLKSGVGGLVSVFS